MIAFDRAAFFALFGSYNAAIWPAQVAAYALGLLVLATTLRRVPQRDRLAAAVLAAMWAWNAVAYHWLHFATINFLAPVFAAAFVVQAALLAWTGVVRGRVAIGFQPDAAGWGGLALILFALAGYPLLGWIAGQDWPEVPMFGVAPCPTTIFTLGVLLLARAPWHLFAVPLAWAAVGGSAAWLLDVPQDLALPLAALLALALRIRTRR